MTNSLWAVCCYFNPCRYARRRLNYGTFREHLGVPLLTIELSHDGEFELREDDADRMLRRRSPHVLWQKERLLNLAIASLPKSCDKVAWLDADVILDRDDWPEETMRLLDDHALVQLFSHFVDLPRDAVDPPSDVGPTGRGFALLYAQGEHEVELFDAMWGSDVCRTSEGVSMRRRLSSGFAWAGRRELLEKHGLYDACILGSGDRAIACAAYGRASTAKLNFLRSEPQRRHFLAWTEPFGASIAGRVTYLEGMVRHLWHGELRDRHYRERWRELASYGFDPHTDIALDDEGCWRWSSDKPAMHSYVRRYFERRQEDGSPATPAGRRHP